MYYNGNNKYMEVECHRGMMTNVNVIIDSNSYEKVETFKYLGSLYKIQNYIHKE